MAQINLFDAIKTVQDCMEQFTDMQLKKFNDNVTAEIDKRKANNNYNPVQRKGMDNLADGKKPKKE